MKIALLCSDCGSRNYSLNKPVHNDRLTMKKYCSRCNKHTTHKSSI